MVSKRSMSLKSQKNIKYWNSWLRKCFKSENKLLSTFSKKPALTDHLIEVTVGKKIEDRITLTRAITKGKKPTSLSDSAPDQTSSTTNPQGIRLQSKSKLT